MYVNINAQTVTRKHNIDKLTMANVESKKNDL